MILKTILFPMIPKTMSFNNSLEGLIKCGKAVILMVTVNIVKGYRLEPTEESHIERSPGETKGRLPIVLCKFHKQCLILQAMMDDNICKVLATRVSHLTLDVQDFYWGSVTEAGRPCITDLTYWSLQLHTGQIHTMWPRVSDVQKQVFTISQIVRIIYLVKLTQCGPRPQAYKNTLIRKDIPKA